MGGAEATFNDATWLEIKLNSYRLFVALSSWRLKKPDGLFEKHLLY
jgi:hypothetical protein